MPSASKKPTQITVRVPDPTPPPAPPKTFGAHLLHSLTNSLKRGASVAVTDANAKLGRWMREDPMGQIVKGELEHANRVASIATGGGPGPLDAAVATAAAELAKKLQPDD